MDKRSTNDQYSLFVRSGTDAAELWLSVTPMSLATFRDARFKSLTAGLGSYDDLSARREAFNNAYAHRIAQEIAGGVRHG